MSKTIRGAKGLGFEYWASRYTKEKFCIGKKVKRRTHKQERLNNKRDLRNLL